jgi:hypothetical protein
MDAYLHAHQYEPVRFQALAEELRNAREHFVELLASLWPVTGTEHWEQITGSRGKERTEVRF